MAEELSSRRRSTKHDGVGFAHNTEINKIEAEHSARVEKAVAAVVEHHNIGREAALEMLTRHLLESGVQATHLYEELEPGNFKNTGISRYFAMAKWKELLSK